MDNSKFVETMKKFGFAEYEAKCYLALFEKESLSVGEIESLSNVPRSNIYAIMKKLLAKGLCVALPGKVKKYAASDPDLFKNEIMTSLDNTKKDVENLVTRINTLFEENKKNSDPLDYIEVLRNPMQIHCKYLELYSQAQKEILSFTKPPFSFATEKQLKEQFQVQFDAVDRNVVIRGIFEIPPGSEQEENFGKVVASKRIARVSVKQHEIRVYDELPVKMFVFDNKTCFFALEDPIKGKTSLTMLLTEHKAMANSFRFLFESFWEKARDYYVIDGKKHYLYPEEERKRRRGGKD